MIFHMDQAEPKGKLKNVIGYTASSTADYEVEIAAGTEERGQWKDIKSRCGKIPVGQTVGFGDTGVANVVELDGSNDNVLNIDRAPGAATLTIANQQETVKSKLIFSKQDDGYKLSSVTEDTYTAVRDGKKITGAKLRLTYQGNDTTLAAVTSNLDGKTGAPVLGDNDTSLTWTVTDTDLALEGLPHGEYLLEELEAPALYQPIAPVKIQVSNDAPVVTNADADEKKAVPVFVQSDSENHTYTLSIYDSVYSISVRKLSKNGKPLPGAVLELTGKNGDKEIDLSGVRAHDSQFFTADGLGQSKSVNINYLLPEETNLVPNEAKSDTAYRWHSIGSAVIFTGLPEGKYTLTEIETPLGYLPVTTEFEIKRGADGRLIAEGELVESTSHDKITLTDESVTLSISKEDMGGKSLDDAEFTLEKLGTDGNPVAIGKIAISKSGESVTGIETSVKDDADGNPNNDKTVTIDAKGVTSFEIRGNTMQHVTVDGKAVLTGEAAAAETPAQNTYTYSGKTSGDQLVISGL
ncbi:MAG: hypothetical protein J6P20_07055, partial [Oscillospiraceae bacterium]|nr:hypothetical protein [Oscillospiraceae bacterium]